VRYDYQHREQFIDPRTGHSPAELASVSVLASTATAADALSTAIMVLGRVEGLALAVRLPGVEALVVTKTMQIYRTSGFPTA
jgi:thiamine biosynthesis lipoprotein